MATYEEEIRKQMDANSAAWHTASTQAEKDALHAANEKLASQLNSNASFNSNTGTWSNLGSGSNSGANGGNFGMSAMLQNAVNFANENKDTLVNGAQRLISEYQQEQQQKQATDLTQYLKDMYAANTEAALSQLKGAYQSGLAGYEAQEAKLPELYDAQRNRQAAQDAIARMNWDERSAANGMNSGTSGQAALSRSAAYRGALADIDAAQANAQSDIDLAKNNLLTQYQNAIQQTEAQNKSALAQALYNELVRQDENTSADTIASLKTALSEAQNATAAATSSAKPALTASQAYTAYKNGIRTDEVMGAMDYYYGIGGNGSDYAIPTSAPTGTKTATTKKAGSVVNNGGLSASDVAKVQAAFNDKYGYSLATDGSWGPDSQKTTGYADAASAMAALGGSLNAQTGNNDINRIMSAVMQYIQQGYEDKADNLITNNWNSFSGMQQSQIRSALKQYGYDVG